jgi:hypothetical protein
MTARLNILTFAIFTYSLVICFTMKTELSSRRLNVVVSKSSKSKNNDLFLVKDLVKNFPSIAKLSFKENGLNK